MLPGERWGGALVVAAAGLMLIAVVLVFAVAPDPVNLTSDVERYAQRIFYFHVPNWWVGFLAYLVAAVAGVLYLTQGHERWDIVEVASVEIGLTFTTIGLISGSIWAKPTWNTWWTWEPRLTTAAIGWLMYAGYLMLRSAIDHPERRARFSAVFSIMAFLSVPITFLAIRWWRTIHPVVIGGSSDFGSGGFALGPTISLVFFYCLFAFTVLYIALLMLRARSEWLARRVQQLRQDTLYRYRS